MPVPQGTRFRVRTTKKGEKIRQAFQGNTVIEAKNLRTGATHTSAEFKRDRAKRKGSRLRRAMGA